MDRKAPLQIIDTRVEVPSGRIQMRIWTPSGATIEPVILFHDSLGCIDLWREFPALLAQRLGRPVMAYDRLGYGRSDARSDDLIQSTRAGNSFIYEEAQKFLPLVLEGLKRSLSSTVVNFSNSFSGSSASSSEKVILYGHSVGGAMALIAAKLLGPKLCKAVITEAAQMFVEEKTLDGIRTAKTLNEDGETVMKLKKYHGEKARWVFDAWAETWLSRDFTGWSLRDFLPQVACPVLAIHGDRDEYGSLRHPQMICELVGPAVDGPSVGGMDGRVMNLREKIILKDCGHVPHREQPQLVLEKIQKFLILDR